MKVLTYLVFLFITAIIVSPAFSAERVYYGSRVGMYFDIVQKFDVNSEKALVTLEPSEKGAVEYCNSWVDNRTKDTLNKCFREQFNSTRTFNQVVGGNCKTGKFIALDNREYIFKSQNNIYDIEAKKDLEDVFGITSQLKSQFKAICPVKFSQGNIQNKANEEYIGKWYEKNIKVCQKNRHENLLVFKNKSMEQGSETSCNIISHEYRNEMHSFNMKCASEGEEYITTVFAYIKGDQIQLYEKTNGRQNPAGTYKKCPK